jgi:hypothetical protein
MVWNRQVGQPQYQSTKPIKVAIGIPYTVDVTMFFALRTLGPLIYGALPGVEKIHKMVRGVPQSVARDQIAELALQDPAVTHILWVDTDSICESPNDPNEALKMLLQMDAPIASGLYRAKQQQGFDYAMWMNANLPGNQTGFVAVSSWSGNWIQVDTIGFGFVLTKREVFEKLPKPWFPWPTPAPSEDFNFCIAAKKYGYAINVLTDVKIMHLGDLAVHTDGRITTLEV